MLYSVLGNKKIKKSLGKDLFIYPFKESNLKGSSYNLTASKVAYLLSNKKIAVNGKDEIVVPPGETVLIQTVESIYTRKNICGTYHSKVSLVTEGFSHISTTLDPGYMGTSLIAITNNTKDIKRIKCGDSIVTIMFYKVAGCNKEAKDNSPGRDDLIPKEFGGFSQNLSNKQEDNLTKEIRKTRDYEWKKDYQALIDIVRKEYEIKGVGFLDLFYGIILIIISVFVIILFSRNKIDLGVFLTLIIAILGLFIPLIKELINKNKR